MQLGIFPGCIFFFCLPEMKLVVRGDLFFYTGRLYLWMLRHLRKIESGLRDLCPVKIFLENFLSFVFL